MLYQTYHPLYFPCIASSSPSKSLPTSISQVEKETECIMKGGYKPEILVGFGPKQLISQDNNSSVSVSVSISGEDLFVDQLLNLNHEDNNNTLEDYNDNHKDNEETGYLFEVQTQTDNPNSNNKLSTFPNTSPHALETKPNKDDFGSVISLPAEQGDLEWLSQFVEESFSQFSTPYPAVFGSGFGSSSISKESKPKSEPEPESRTSQGRCFIPPTALSKSRRSKRVRTGGRVWSTTLPDSSSMSTPSSPSTNTASSSPPSSPGSNPDPTQPKKQKKKTGGLGGGPTRRCSHCGVQKTPQWRTGPQGAKTLCNACGVRFKSGRLLPEYRPACSPTFSSELHSNNHRKVLEMRRKKEVAVTGRPEPGLSHPVSSFG